jgi:regulator of protease activity HflC (stomatin/prohibitin superfamily)
VAKPSREYLENQEAVTVELRNTEDSLKPIPRTGLPSVSRGRRSTRAKVRQSSHFSRQRDDVNSRSRRHRQWGVEVTLVELKDIQLPESMKRAMAKQAETEREKRAKIINAEGSDVPPDTLG